MNEEHPFNTEEERRIQEILFKALPIEDELEQELFIKKECGDDLRLYRRLMADLHEAREGESARLRFVIRDGEEIGNYKIIGGMKEGGFATVYTAEHKISRTFAAIKIFDKLVGEDEKDLFWNNEFKSLSKLDHDNIVKFYDLGFYTKDGKTLPYVIVELVQGKHLDEHCKVKDPSVREVLGLFRSLSGVIQYIHSRQNLMHLDLKPSNIFVTSNRPYRIKLIDFGSSKLFRNEPRRLTRRDFINPLTRKFASPEQFDEDAGVDHQSDIYSLGAVLYFLFTEKVPFGEGETDKEKIKQDVTDRNLLPIPPSRRVLELERKTKFGLPPENLSEVLAGDLDFIIMKCLQKRRRDRYQTVAELNQDFDNFLKGKPLKTRRKPFGYKAYKTVTHLLGMEGGLSGWSKWEKPAVRATVLGILLALSGFIIGYVISTQEDYVSLPKSLKKQEMRLRVREGDLEYPNQRFNAYYIRCGDEQDTCFSFIEIPNGSFEMGKRPEEKFSLNPEEEAVFKLQEKEENFFPPHRVTIRRFYMGRFEITNRQWNSVARMRKVRIPLEATDDDSPLPKTNISYAKAKEFCARLTSDLSNYTQKEVHVRLPTEAEWEYACRAGTTTKFGGGDIFEENFINAISIPGGDTPPWAKTLLKKLRTNTLDDSAFVANPFGLAAMNGNVWEMVSDSWHDRNDGSAPADGTAWDEIIDMSEKSSGKYYVLRGGAFSRPAYMSQCFYRTEGRFISSGNEQTGFRVVLEVEE